MIGSAIAGAAVSGAMQGGMNVGIAALNNYWAQKREERARYENFMYNEQSAIAADKRARQLYNDLQSPEALLKQYKEAGLSPSLMFGGGGVGGQMQQGAQGAGAAGISPTNFGANPVEIAQTHLLQAQAEKITEETKTLRGENDRGWAEIDNIIEHTKNVRLKNTYQNYNNQIEEILLEIQKATKGNQIEISQYTEDKLNAEVQILEEQINQEVVKTDISEATKNSMIEKIKNEALQSEIQLALMRNQKRLIDAQINLTNKQIEDLASEITKRAWDMRKDLYEAKRDLTYWETQCKQWCVEQGIEIDKTTAKGIGVLTGILAGILAKFPMSNTTTVTGFKM